MKIHQLSLFMHNFYRSDRNHRKINIIVLTITALVLINVSLFAQAPLKQWDARFGGSEGDFLYDISPTADNGYIMGGTSFSGVGGDKTEENFSQGYYTYSDFWIVKIDANGWKEWDGSYGGDGSEFFSTVHQTLEGGYILAGASAELTGNGEFDYWIVKIDSNGIKQWDANFGGSKSDYLTCLELTSDGGYILGGSSNSAVDGDKTQEGQGLTDYWIVKIDSNGTKEWDADFGGDKDDDLVSLQQTSDKGYILGGISWSGISGDKTQENQGGFDYWILKIDSNGLKQWDAGFGGGSAEYLQTISQTRDHGFILGGTSYSEISGDKTQGSQGSSDYWMVKTDSNGLKQWDYRFGGNGTESLSSLLQTPDGGHILGGYSNSNISGEKTEATQGSSDYWVVKIDSNGLKQWDTEFGGSDADELKSIRLTSDNGYILAGSSLSEISGDKTQTSQGDRDYWIVKTRGYESLVQSSIPFFLYPNPTKGQLNIKFYLPQDSQVSIEINDLSGRKVDILFDHQLELGVHSLPFNVGNFLKGTYIVSAVSAMGIANMKLVIQ
jgi:hypothetical protein